MRHTSPKVDANHPHTNLRDSNSYVFSSCPANGCSWMHTQRWLIPMLPCYFAATPLLYSMLARPLAGWERRLFCGTRVAPAILRAVRRGIQGHQLQVRQLPHHHAPPHPRRWQNRCRYYRRQPEGSHQTVTFGRTKLRCFVLCPLSDDSDPLIRSRALLLRAVWASWRDPARGETVCAVANRNSDSPRPKLWMYFCWFQCCDACGDHSSHSTRPSTMFNHLIWHQNEILYNVLLIKENEWDEELWYCTMWYKIKS